MKEVQAGLGTVMVPDWVESIREAQDYVLVMMELAIEEGYEVIVLQASTGFGKSLVAYMLAQRLGLTLVYAPPHKPLQKQFCDNFPDSIVVQGQANYACPDMKHAYPDIHCGLCVKGNYCQSGPCEYRQVRHTARTRIENGSSSPVVLNTAYWLASIRYTGLDKRPLDNPFWRRPLTVIDEADSLEGVLMGALTVSISSSMISMVNLPKEHRKPPKRSKPDEPIEERWPKWLAAFEVALKERCDNLKQTLAEQGKDVSDSLVKASQSADRLYASLKDVTPDWIYSVSSYGSVTLKPVVPSIVSKRFIKNRYPMLLMSATIIDPDQLIRDVGLEGAKIKWIEAPAPWDARRSPIIRISSVNVTKNRKKEDWDARDDGGNFIQDAWEPLVAAVLWVLMRHPQYRTVVHCVSNDLAHSLQSTICQILSERMCLTYETEAAKNSALDAFRKNSASVIFGSSISRGYDFPDDDCRVQIWAKVPWPNLGDPQIKARFAYKDPETGHYDGRHWFEVQAIRELVQGAGRAPRSGHDWCWTYMIDSQFERLWRNPRTKNIFPVEFKSRVLPRGYLDDPLTRLIETGEIKIVP